MSLRFVCIEVRRNLHCANVFLQFDHSLTETEFLKINVDEDALTLREYSTATRVSVAQHFTIEARTISNLTVEECNASFRLTVDNIAEDVSASASKNGEAQQIGKSVALQPQVEEREPVVVHCGNCDCDLTDAVSYQRIREFPSGSIDMSEFFCHQHHGAEKYKELLLPQANDLFYGFQFIVVNAGVLQRRVKVKETHVYCGRCLQYLGVTLSEGKAVKLWADVLLLQRQQTQEYPGGEQCNVFNSGSRTPTSQLLQKIINETTLDTGESLLQQVHFSKVLLETTFPSRQRKFLLLHILEKQLQVLRNVKPLAHGSHNNNNVLQVQLEGFKCFKLLYRLMDEATTEIGQRDDDSGRGNEAADEAGNSCEVLLSSWKHDISIHALKVSPTLFSELLAELEDNSMLLPELYRYTHDHFQLSYVFYQD